MNTKLIKAYALLLDVNMGDISTNKYIEDVIKNLQVVMSIAERDAAIKLYHKNYKG